MNADNLCYKTHICLACTVPLSCGTYVWACPWLNGDEDAFCDNCMKEMYDEEV